MLLLLSFALPLSITQSHWLSHFEFNPERLLQLRVQGYLLPKSAESLDEFGDKPLQEAETPALPSAEELVAIARLATVQKDMLQVIFEALQKVS